MVKIDQTDGTHAFKLTGLGLLVGAFMNGATELPYPQWQVPLQEVILECDREKLAQKALQAEDAIVERLRELRLSNDGHHERNAIRYGLSLLKMVKSDRLGYPDW